MNDLGPYQALNPQAITKETRRKVSLQFPAGAIDLSKSVGLNDSQCKSCVLYLNGKIERRTAWFSSKERASISFKIMKAKYGRAIIYLD